MIKAIHWVLSGVAHYYYIGASTKEKYSDYIYTYQTLFYTDAGIAIKFLYFILIDTLSHRTEVITKYKLSNNYSVLILHKYKPVFALAQHYGGANTILNMVWAQ